MRGRQMAEMIVQLVQVLDQQVAPPRRIAQQLLHFCERLDIDRPAFRDRPGFAFSWPPIIRQRRAAAT